MRARDHGKLKTKHKQRSSRSILVLVETGTEQDNGANAGVGLPPESVFSLRRNISWFM